MSGELYIIGIGPGSKDYITPMAQRHIAECDLLLGHERLTRLFAIPSHELDLRGDPPEAVKFILAHRSRLNMAVLVSGDPGLHSFLRVLRRYLNEDEYEVVPGISSVQLAFAKLKDCWEDATILRLHGLEGDAWVTVVEEHPKVAILTDQRWTPREIARRLLEHGIEDREFIICENLSYPEERILRTDICTALNAAEAEGLNLVIVREKKG